MAWRSPYREESKKPPSVVGRWLSRGTMCVIGVIFAFYGLRGLFGLQDLYVQHPPSLTYTNYRGRTSVNWFVILAPLGMASLTLIGVSLAVAAFLSVDVLQKVFEKLHRPPVSGDRGSDSGWNRWWWWWP